MSVLAKYLYLRTMHAVFFAHSFGNILLSYTQTHFTHAIQKHTFSIKWTNAKNIFGLYRVSECVYMCVIYDELFASLSVWCWWFFVFVAVATAILWMPHIFFLVLLKLTPMKNESRITYNHHFWPPILSPNEKEVAEIIPKSTNDHWDLRSLTGVDLRNDM